MYIIIISIVVLVIAFMFRPSKEAYKSMKSNVPIIYGAGFCGHCTTQKKDLDEANVDYVYYDCSLPENKTTCTGITSFPTIQFPNEKEKVIGRQPIDKFKGYIKK
jgi:glutaredoxin